MVIYQSKREDKLFSLNDFFWGVRIMKRFHQLYDRLCSTQLGSIFLNFKKKGRSDSQDTVNPSTDHAEELVSHSQSLR